MAISEQTYEQVALEDGDEQWELVCGRLRAKPPMTLDHNEVPRALADILRRFLRRANYSIAETARLRVSTGNFLIPDLCVIPRGSVLRHRAERPTNLEIYDDPLPLVVEVWSPSTGSYDVAEKLQHYQQRGDAEIWRIHPYERTLTAWRRQPDGSYIETLYRDGAVPAGSLPGVVIELAELFE
ncbi:MAG: Uma2 family endonuclease [Dehalococcoidia bacterium]